MREHGPEPTKYLFPLVHDFVRAEFGQQPWTLVLDYLHHSGTL
jgi:hypothetical protein